MAQNDSKNSGEVIGRLKRCKTEPYTEVKSDVATTSNAGYDASGSGNAAEVAIHDVICKCSPRMLVTAFDVMNSAQKMAADEMGFGNLMHIQVTEIPSKMAYWCLQHFNPVRCSLEIPGKAELDIEEEDVWITFGIPKGNLNVHRNGKRSKSPLLDEWAMSIGKSKEKMSTEDVLRAMLRDVDGGVWFKRNFMILMESCIFECSADGVIRPKIIDCLSDLSVIHEYNWCAHLMAALSRHHAIWKQNSTMYFTGPLLFLVMYYVDRVDAYSFAAQREFPIVRGWTTLNIGVRERLDVNSGGFGNGEIKDRYKPNDGVVPRRSVEVMIPTKKDEHHGKHGVGILGSGSAKNFSSSSVLINHTSAALRTQRNKLYDLCLDPYSIKNVLYYWIQTDKKTDVHKVVYDDGNVMATLYDFKTLKPDQTVAIGLIDAWSSYLNLSEESRWVGSPRRLFFTTYPCTYTVVNKQGSWDESRVRAVFGETIKQEMDRNFNCNLATVNMVFFPILQSTHYFVICFDMRRMCTVLIDSSNVGDETDVYVKYGNTPHTLRSLFCGFIRHHISNERVAMLMVNDVQIMRMPWREDTNPRDCGVLAMSHMQSYKGQNVGDWDFGIEDNDHDKVTWLRARYCGLLLESPLNKCAADNVTAATLHNAKSGDTDILRLFKGLQYSNMEM